MSKKIRISVTNEILQEDDSTFAKITVDSLGEITMDNCRNLVARNLAKKVFKEGGKYSSGMWTAEIINNPNALTEG